MKRFLLTATAAWAQCSSIHSLVAFPAIGSGCNNKHHGTNHRCGREKFAPTTTTLPASTASRGVIDDSPSSPSPSPSTRVVVVGAGISGLSVAYHLSKLSSGLVCKSGGASQEPFLDIEILEVRNRIGGRIEPFLIDDGSLPNQASNHSNNNNNNIWIDLGGQWLHESSPENPIRRLLEDDLGLGFVGKNQTPQPNRFHARRLKNVLFDRDGTRMDRGAVQRAKNVFYKAVGDLDGESVRLRHLVSERDPNEISFRDLLDARTEALRERSPGDPDKQRRQQASFERALNYFVHRSEENEGGKFHEVSAVLANNLYEGAGTAPDRVVEGSYRSLLRALSNKLGLVDDHGENHGGDSINNNNNNNNSCGSNEEAKRFCRVNLRPNARVERIDYGSGSNSNSNSNSNEERISLSIAENEMPSATTGGVAPGATSVLECDYCVCTVPLGVLQQRKIEFFPPLPERRREAIDGIGMGVLNKIVFRFDFEATLGGNKFWGDLKQFGICHQDPSMVKTYYDCTDDYYYHRANNNDDDDDDNDEEEDPTMSSAILVQFLAGSAADRVDPPLQGAETDHQPGGSVLPKVVGLTDGEAIEESLRALRSVFGSENVPDPSVSKVTRWRNDPWSCGSYSFARVGSSPGMYDEIASPLGRLLFAGEHTSKHCHGTVHGAWETGAREAQRIFEKLQNRNNPGDR